MCFKEIKSVNDQTLDDYGFTSKEILCYYYFIRPLILLSQEEN